MSHVTQILRSIEQGETEASDKLLPLVYDELKRLAARRLANEELGHTYSPRHFSMKRIFVSSTSNWIASTGS